jgi:hypothetical protein
MRARPTRERNDGGERTRARTCKKIAARYNGQGNLQKACVNGRNHNGAVAIVVK